VSAHRLTGVRESEQAHQSLQVGNRRSSAPPAIVFLMTERVAILRDEWFARGTSPRGG
jgi:hypothetical protein